MSHKGCISGISVGWNIFNFCKATNHRTGKCQQQYPYLCINVFIPPQLFLFRVMGEREHFRFITSPKPGSILTNTTATLKLALTFDLDAEVMNYKILAHRKSTWRKAYIGTKCQLYTERARFKMLSYHNNQWIWWDTNGFFFHNFV